jgi:hypothetical protein
VSESSIELEGVYVNHAPSITKLVLRNLNKGQRTLVRIESDLGRGLSFLKRKRSVVPDCECSRAYSFSCLPQC